MNPLISIVIPIYNQEAYIRDCLNSVFSQCQDRIEVILVNDGSTDRSLSLCQEMISRFPVNARLIDQENQGALKSRLNGIAASSGEYIFFVDSDDILLENALGALIPAIEKSRPDMVLFNATNSLTARTPLFKIPLPHGEMLTGEDRYKVYELLCGTDTLNNLWTKCIRKELFSHLEPEGGKGRLTNGEDLYQILTLADHASSFMYLDRVLYYYRVMENSISRVYNPHYFSSEKTVCQKRLQYAEKWSHADELVAPVRVQTYKIMREVARKLLISSLPWREVRKTMQAFRSDDFFKSHYLNAHDAPDKRDIVLKGPYPLMFAARILVRIKAKLK